MSATDQGSLAVSARVARRGASRPTIILGFASIGGVVGIIAGAIGAAVGRVVSLPDHVGLLPFCVVVGAWLGWLLGGGLGVAVSEGARPPGTTGRRLVLAGAVAVVLGASVVAIWPLAAEVSVGGSTYFSFWRAGGAMAAFEIAAMVGAAIVLLTFLVVLRDHDGEGAGVPGRIAGATGITGLLLGALVFALGLWVVGTTWSETLAHQRDPAVSRTAGSIADAVEEHEKLTGSFPTNLDEILAAGGKVHPGVQVEFAGVVDGKFCVRVGTDIGEQQAGDPHYSSVVRRPTGEQGRTSVHTWEGNYRTSPGRLLRGTDDGGAAD